MKTLRNNAVGALLMLAAAGGVAGCASPAHPSAPSAQAAIATSQKGETGGNPNLPCMPADVARLAVAAPGVAASTLTALNPAPLTIVDDSTSGMLAFFRTEVALPSSAATLFTSSSLVPTDPSLQSCDYMLSDRPAAQPFIQAAIAAAVTRNLAPSTASLSASISGVEIGDNPATPNSIIVILLVTGAPQATVNGHTVYGPYSSIFVIMNRATMTITGVGQGGW